MLEKVKGTVGTIEIMGTMGIAHLSHSQAAIPLYAGRPKRELPIKEGNSTNS